MIPQFSTNLFTMVFQNSEPNTSSNFMHQFIISDSNNTSQTQYEEQQFDPYSSSLRETNTYPQQSHGFLPSIQSLGDRMSSSVDLVQAPPMAEQSGMSHTRHLMDLLGATNDNNHQRLSLSLNSGMLVPSVMYRQQNYLVPTEEDEEGRATYNTTDEYPYASSTFSSSSASLNRSCTTSYRTESYACALGNSRYLKPARSLLEEIVSDGGKAIDISNEKYVAKLSSNGRRGSLEISAEVKAEFCSSGLVSSEKQELGVKITKLISLLEEVEHRYEKYCHQMEEVVSSFEMIVGEGSAKSYTALALQAMSRHFCSLKEAILYQINVSKRKFSQDSPKISTGLSQLSLFDRQSRLNKMSLQQLGMIQSQRQAWRPIRGLPETSVAILRAWLFEHFLHPYPNDTEKLTLASQTGLTKNQVSNWFINARVRLWKPMIEEIYKEEFGESPEDSNPSLGSCSLTRKEDFTHDADEGNLL